MTLAAIEQDFRTNVSAEIRLEPAGVERYRVFTPFQFDDGDHLVIILRCASGQWVLSDEGHTFMHFGIDLDERPASQDKRQQIIADTLKAFAVEDDGGELRIRIDDGRYGEALNGFVQALLQINKLAASVSADRPTL